MAKEMIHGPYGKPENPRQPDGGGLRAERRKGLAATSVDEICAAAAAGYHWSAVTEPVIEAAAYHAPDDPVDRLLGYIDLRREMTAGEIAEFTCFAGTMWCRRPGRRAQRCAQRPGTA